MNHFLLLTVWEAAVGEPENLARLLRSDFSLSRELRNELALLIEGKLVPGPSVRGRPAADEYPSMTIARWVFSKQYQAQENYNRVANWLRARGRLYGQAEKLAVAIARKWEIPQETFLNDLRRPNKPPRLTVPESGEGADFQRFLARRRKRNNLRKKIGLLATFSAVD